MDRRSFWSLILIRWAWNPHMYIAMSELVEIDTAALMLGLSVRTLRNWERRKLMPPRQKRGKTYYYREIDIEYLKEHLLGRQIAYHRQRDGLINASDMKAGA